MPLSDVERATFDRLLQQVQNATYPLTLARSYYEGEQRLAQLGLAIPPKMASMLTIVNWPRMAADGIEERLDIEGFRYPGVDEADTELWRVWQDNNLDEESQLAHLDALIYGRSYVCVGANESDPETPLVTVESPFELAHEVDPRRRAVSSALRVYGIVNGRATRATLYLPEATVWMAEGDYGWAEVDRDRHQLGVVPVVPIVNRARASNRAGSSEMTDVIPLTDAAARTLTNLQVAQETHAVPQRFVVGASQGDFVDQEGRPVTKWQAYFSSVWSLANENAKVGQLAPSDLSNLTNTVEHYARLASGVSALPPSYFGLAADDAASADAIRSREARLVKRCERKQTAWSGSWEQVMRLVLRIATGGEVLDARRLETIWRDPATPTKAQQADAAVKLVQSGILPREGAWDELKLSPARQERLREQFRRQDELDPVGALARGAGQQQLTDA